MAKKDLMASIPLFRGCSSRELAHISRLATRVDVPSGKVLAREGTAGELFYVIDRGEADVTIGGALVAQLKEGGFFGEMALLDDLPRTATVTATTPMVLYAIKAADFGRFLDESPSVLRSILKTVSERLRSAEKAPAYDSKSL